MRIGIVATRLAGVDGVTFETAKWEAVLDRLGHEIRLCAGEVDALRYVSRLVPPMHFTYPPAERVTEAAFDPESDPDAVRAEVERLAAQLLPVLQDWVEDHAARHARRRERMGHPDAAPARARAAPARRGDRAGRDRPPPRLLVGARALRDPRRAGPDRGRVSSRPAERPSREHQLARRQRALSAPGDRVDRDPERVRLRPAAAAQASRRSPPPAGGARHGRAWAARSSSRRASCRARGSSSPSSSSAG